MPKLTKDEVLLAIQGSGGFITNIAKRLRVSRPTLYKFLKQYPDVAEMIYDEKEALKDFAEFQLYELIKEKHPAAIFFFLKTQAKERGYIERSDVYVEGRVETLNLAAISDKELMTLARQIEEEKLLLT